MISFLMASWSLVTVTNLLLALLSREQYLVVSIRLHLKKTEELPPIHLHGSFPKGNKVVL